MSDRFKFSLSSMWLFVTIFTIILPVFLPSVESSPYSANNAIGVATASMFILSFPSSLFGVPLLAFVNASLSVVNPNSIEGMYINLLVLFALGLVQWFWIVPRLWRNDPKFQTIELPLNIRFPALPKPVPNETFRVYDTAGETPVERVIREKM